MSYTAVRRFGVNVAVARRQRRLTQEELAAKAGVHRLTVVKIESGKRHASTDMAIRLAGALGVDARQLLGWNPTTE